MQLTRVGILLAGFALAGASVYMVQQYVGQTQAQHKRDQDTLREIGQVVKVYVVNKPLNYGDVLTPEDVQTIYWPKKALPEGIFTAENPPFVEGQKDPRYVLRQFETYEPLLAVKVTEPGETAGLTNMLAPGQRAFTINFSDTAGASRLLQPTNRVDVYWTGVTMTGQEKTMLIESAVEIIAVDRPEGKSRDGNNFQVPKAMTVSVSPEQVARLAQAQASGKLSVSLVGTSEGSETVSNLEVDTSIFGVADIQVADTPKACTVRKRVGTDVVEVEIPCTN
ncbi:Flp pilus assembly protein CpaB [Gemmobacter serpentinus]|uniref:Flp pilus assembly protein CpaB n=1 Tax=Gemmobacter serpentinus TaxID=2652247 RepID=UPI00124CFAB3|nr:Flp pilus assembly protein CpaB [Gemmobacter serpentinus]